MCPVKQSESKWTAVVNPRPVYEGGPDEKARWEAAERATVREPGEDVCAWLKRVGLAAGVAPLGDRELPPGDREPGEDG